MDINQVFDFLYSDMTRTDLDSLDDQTLFAFASISRHWADLADLQTKRRKEKEDEKENASQ